MKRFFIIVPMVLLFAGCIPMGDVELQLTRLTATVDDLMDEVDDYQAAYAESSDEADSQIDAVQDDVLLVNEALKRAKEENLSMLETLEAANEASAPFNPYSAPIGLALSALTVGAGIWGNQKRKDANDLELLATEIETKYKAMKRGTDKFRNANPEKAGELYDDIGAARVNRGIT